MDHFTLFFNNRTLNTDSLSLTDLPVAFGDWILTPVRCLFNGNKVTVSTKNAIVTVDHEKEYYVNSARGWHKPKRNFLRVVASIVLLMPCLLIGSFIKGLGYLSKSIRERHLLAIQHFIPVHRTIGPEGERLNLEQIKQRLNEQNQNNHLHQPTKSLIIYAQPGTRIKEDPGILALDPQKLILVGAWLVHGPSARGCLDEQLDSSWEQRTILPFNVESFAVQRQANSIAEALEDLPPRRSFFSDRYKRIYILP